MKRLIMSCCVTLLFLQGYAQNNWTSAGKWLWKTINKPG